MTPPRICFFGTPDFAVHVLDALDARGYRPVLIVTQPDKPKGRSLVMTPPPVKVWADARSIPTLQPKTLKDEAAIAPLLDGSWDIGIVAAYGFILPPRILSMARLPLLNVHPSLLPKYRGASPIQGQILSDDAHCGVTIMQMDEEMDHGPLVAQKEVAPPEWPMKAPSLSDLLAKEGGELLADTIASYLRGDSNPTPQTHAEATYTKKIEKEDGLVRLAEDSPREMYLKFCAYAPWPGIYFFIKKGNKELRVKIQDAEYTKDSSGVYRFRPLIVIPEGKSPMSYKVFMSSFE